MTTNIHWHGLVVPKDQDGPTRTIKPGERFSYRFVAGEPGTYWYHSQYQPVLEQMDMGLYGAFIVTEPLKGKVGTVVKVRFVNKDAMMRHCHIIDHEDNGLMTMVQAN